MARPRNIKRTIIQCKTVENAFKSGALVKDVHKAELKVLEYYVKNLMANRFKGQAYNPDYPKLSADYVKRKNKRFGPRPKLVATGRLRQRTLQSRPYKTTRGPVLRVKRMYYSQYIRRRFNYISPKLKSEQKTLERYFKRVLSIIRRRRKRLSV